MDIFGLVEPVKNFLQSVRRRYEHFLGNKQEFDDLDDNLVRITQNLAEIKQEMDSRSHADNNGYIDRHLQTASTDMQACREVLEKLAKGPFQAHSGSSYARVSGTRSQITGANRIHERLNKVSTTFDRVERRLDAAKILLSKSEVSRAPSSTEGDRYRGISSVPILTHQEVLDFDGKDEDGNLTPEAQLKKHVLDRDSNKVVAAEGVSSEPCARVQSVCGMAGVGKTVALKGLGRDRQVREAFEEVHYITLGHDASNDTVVSELARIVQISGGDRQSCTVRGCKDVHEAVSHTTRWFYGRKCLFLVDDLWKTGQSNYGYLPALRQLLSTSEGSRMAITTRDSTIAGEAGQAVKFGWRGSATSRKILLSYFGDLNVSSAEGSGDESIMKILRMCNGVPLVLAVAGRGARALKEEGRSGGDALADYANILERGQASLFEESPPGYGREDESLTLKAAMEISLAFLERRCKSAGITYGMGYAEMYQALGILKAQTWAPLSMLSRLWNVNRDDALRIMGQLCTMSLTRWEDQSYKTSSNVDKKESGLKIHDLQLKYCRQHCKELRRLHGKLLERYLEVGKVESSTKVSDANVGRHGEDAFMYAESRPWWSARVAEEGYVHANVAWHLVNAGKRDELRCMLVDARWIKLRLVVGGIIALENDFAELVRMDDMTDVGGVGSLTESIDCEFRTILNAVRCSWQYVVENERELAVQLGGRLFDIQESSRAARKLLESAVGNSERPFASARYGFLADARSGQVNEVHLGGRGFSLSYSSYGKYIAVAAGEDVVVVEADTLDEKIRFKGHTEYVNSVCFLSESSKIVSGSADGTVRLWDLNEPDANGLTLKGHNAPVLSVCASADGSRVASAALDGSIRLWKLQEESTQGKETIRRSKWMSWFCCSADDTNSDEEVDAAGYGCQVLQGHTDRVSCVCFSPDGALLASASDNGTVRLWNGHTGKHTGVTIEGHEEYVCCVAFSPNGEHVASGSYDKTIRLWRADTGAATGIVIDGHSRAVMSVAFSADGTRIVSASGDRTVRVWNAESGAAIGAPLIGHTDIVFSAVLSPDGARVASVSDDGTLRIWEPEIAGGVSGAREGHSSRAWCAAISTDGYRIGVGHYDGAICIWDTQSGTAIGGRLEGHTLGVYCVAFSADGALLASGSLDNTVRLWNVLTGVAVGGALEGQKCGLKKLLFSADGTKLLSFSDDDDCCLWSVPSGAVLWMSHRSSEDVANEMSDAEAWAAVEAIEIQGQSDTSHETGDVYYDGEESAVMMKHSEGDVRLAWLPPLVEQGTWMHIADRNEFVAVLSDGRPVRLALHV